MEIEKKFVVKNMPSDLNKYQKKTIDQAYLSVKDPVLRIRRSNDDYFLTYKSRLGLADSENLVALTVNEVELVLSKDVYHHLLEKVDYNIIEKTRYLIPLDGNLTAELDIFNGILKGLIIVEVEFSDQNEAKKFIPPSWFGEDVTFDKRFRNNYLVMINNLDEIGRASCRERV